MIETILCCFGSVIISYLIFRQFLKNDKDAKYHPIGFTIFIMLIPVINIITPLALMFMSKIEKMNLNIDYKKFFKLP